MKKLTVNRDHEHFIAVLGPRYKGNYGLIMPGIIKAIDAVESKSDKHKPAFIFVHDGVTSGSTGEVMEAVNILQPMLRGRSRLISMRKLPLDIEMYGKRSHYKWVDNVIGLDPDLFVLLDNGSWDQVDYARRKCERDNIPFVVIKINQEK